MGRVIKMGIVGLGRIGWLMANEEISKYPDKYEIVAACDLLPDRTKKMVDKFGCKEYSDYSEMLKQDDIDIVYIATRSCDHYKHAIMAFEAGKDVLLEKPVTISYEEALDLYSRANKEGCPRLYVHQQRRFEPAFIKAKEIIDSGKLGRVYEVNVEEKGFQHRDDWQTINEYGGGQLLNWGPHIIDHSLQLLGTPVANIQSYLCQVTAGGDCEDHLRIRFTGDNNRVVNMCISGSCALSQGRRYEVFGDRGAVIIEGTQLKMKYINPEQIIPEVISKHETPGAAFGSTGTYQSDIVIDWVTEEFEVPVSDYKPTRFWECLYDTYRDNAPFFITDDDILALMRTISIVKTQNKYIMK